MQFLSWRLSIALALLLVLPGMTTAQGPKKALAGWYDVFPHLGFFSGRFYRAPAVTKNKDDQPVYSQTVRYDAPTGAVRAFDFTLLRDPAIKMTYSPEVLQAAPNPPAEIKIGKYRAWKWEGKGGKQEKIVVVLGDDRAVLISSAARSVANFPLDQADKVNWDKIAEALKNPPRTDFTLTVETFRVLTKGASDSAIYEWCGSPTSFKKHEESPKVYDQRYSLADGTQVVVVSESGRIVTIRHEQKDGKAVDLLK